MGKAKSSEKRGKPNTSPYHVFFQRELKRIKAENPTMAHKVAFKQAGLNWRKSPLNPKNQKDGAQGPSEDQPPAAPAVASEETARAPEPAPAPLEDRAPASPNDKTPVVLTEHVVDPLLANPVFKAEEESKPTLAPLPMIPSLHEHTSAVQKPAEETAEKHAEKPAENHKEHAGSTPSALAIPSMAAHAVNGTLTAAK
ncbi:hypothetical protein IWW50_002043 [Coemansia erecta]|nr:hypothetical protein GGF43_001618 [Coemansia sp. RSA 2618]KAJ2827118.1 hypothetical protein IWW50_002043 [Coemansia erecta]